MTLLQKVLATLRAARHHPAWTPLSRLAALLLVSLSLWYLVWQGWHHWQAFAASGLVVAWPTIALGIALTMVAQLAGALTWHWILRALGHPLPWGQSLSIHLLANAARYLPGYAWQLMGKAYLSHNAGLPPPATRLALTYEFGLVVSLGGLLGLLLWPSAWRPSILVAWPLPLLALLALAGSGAILVAQQRGFRWQGWANRALWLAGLWALIGWLAWGGALWAAARALWSPLPLATWPHFAFAMAWAALVSLAALFVPSGIGVREGTIVFLLGPLELGAVAVITAVLSRLFLVVGDLLGLGIGLLLAKRGFTPPFSGNNPKGLFPENGGN